MGPMDRERALQVPRSHLILPRLNSPQFISHAIEEGAEEILVSFTRDFELSGQSIRADIQPSWWTRLGSTTPINQT
jgi:hypothetical protein